MQAIKTIDLQDYGKWSAAHKCRMNCKGSYEEIYRHVNKFSLKVRFFICVNIGEIWVENLIL